MIALVDCNNFYASCEALFQPKLIGKPVVVLSNNDGCVIARSAEAKALGIPMGVPAYQIDTQGVEIRSSNFALYGDISGRVMRILARFSPRQEIYSIDECFLDLPDDIDLRTLAHDMRATIRREVGIGVGVGIAPTKTLAKAANWKAKKSGAGVWVIDSHKSRQELLASMPVDEIWGVGRKHSKRLISWGIQTALDFTEKVSEVWIQEKMSITGVRTWKELRGKPCILLEDITPPKKSTMVSRTFGTGTDRLNDLEEAVASFALSAAEKIRKDKLAANTITLFFHTDFHRKDREQYSPSGTTSFFSPTNDSFTIIQTALTMLRGLFRPEFLYRKAGVMLGNLVPADEVQLTLFDTGESPARKQLLLAMDAVNYRFGKETVKPAVLGVGGKPWKLKQSLRSGRFTTCWDEIVEVRV